MTKYYSYILFLLISILVVIFYINGIGPIDNLQRSLNDALCSVTAPTGPRPNVVLVKIDGRVIGTGRPGPVTRALVRKYHALTEVSGEPIYK